MNSKIKNAVTKISFLTLLWITVEQAIAGDTLLKLYRPFTEMSQISQPESFGAPHPGRCIGQSHLVQREDAWRCSDGRVTYDPCFLNPAGSQTSVLCPVAPWEKQAVVIQLTQRLDNSKHVALDMSRGYPWGIELSQGDKCLAIDTTQQYDNLPVRYVCQSRSVLFGHIQRCSPTWKVLQHNANGVATITVARAWF